MPTTDAFKVCPFCGEQIRAEAVKCRFCGEWFERRIESPVPVCTNPLLPERKSDDERLPKLTARTEQPPAPSPKSCTILATPPKRVGGWLIALILYLAFVWPIALQDKIAATRKNVLPYFDRVPGIQLATDFYSYFNWGVAILSVYCAYVLAFKRRAALEVAKRSLIWMAILVCAANLSFVTIIRAPAEQVGGALGDCILALIGLGLWYLYLVRSKRVKETYFTGVDSKGLRLSPRASRDPTVDKVGS